MIVSLSKHWTIHDVDVAGFLSEIERINDNIVMESIHRFKKKGGVEQGFNLKYLTGIIKNESKRFKLREEYERKSLDRIPPKLRETNEEY